uniref:Methyltransferase FkbM domain-containing protein n=1 Tax=viral metagenome TaxID=1070528 RepID=A0A6C0JM16_9ZZZZ
MLISDILRKTYNIDFNNLNILECGSGPGPVLETSDFNKTNNCYYIEANYKDYKLIHDLKYNVYHYALSDTNENISFTITSHIGNSSVSHSEIHKQELLSCYNSTFTNVIVPAITYKNFIQNVIKTNIDILILDVEGHESMILNTFFDLDTSELPKIICIEVGYDWNERKPILLKLGYNLDFYEYNNCYLSHSTYNCNKNISNMNYFNQNNKKFIFFNKLIYENELI